ncbi:MAG: T9SS type A sorting domain-containing protein [Bacteroidia bacterium]|nr:T9SS type A sorting domain-containing protein [Bacteroidia bacterium]
MKKQLIALSLTAAALGAQAQQTILSARTATAGTVVTVQGIALNGTELGAARYIQDATGSIMGYHPSSFATINRGDSVKITGTTKDYKCLLELDPITSVVKVNAGNTLPTPIVINPNAFNETYEAQLLRFNNVTFKKTGTFVGNTNYTVVGATTNDTALVRVSNGTQLIGKPIPTGSVNIVGIGSQFSNATTCTSGYQVLLRDTNDIIQNASIFLTADVTQINMTNAGFDVKWNTNVGGAQAYVQWQGAGASGNVSATLATTHIASITGLQAGQIYYVTTYAINGVDTAKSHTKAFATKSNSTGNIKCYFNRTVDNSVSLANNNAIYLNSLVADTLVQYINRAKQTIDLAIYNWGTGPGSAITTAINNAKARGVNIRVIADGSTAQTGTQALAIGANLQLAVSPQGANYTIMHNKFVIIDANSNNANEPLVWTGSTNWTTAQLNTDANNVVIVQDQSLARNYKIEFDEMWGDTIPGGTTNAMKAKYGQFKKDNTAHEFSINGKRVENYFSPSDGVNSKLVNTINTGSTELYTANLSFTKTDVAYAIRNMKWNNPSAIMYSLFDDTSNSFGAFPIIRQVLGNNAMEDQFSWILHHKYAIADQNDATSDPLVWTGSHNWSTAADTKNDENTIVVHDQNVANQFYQEFIQRLRDNNVTPIIASVANKGTKLVATVYPNPANNVINVQLLNNESATLKIYNINGTLVYTALVNNTTVINVSTWTKGMYVVQVVQDATVGTSKIIVE